jgi:serine/threonine protein kinase
VSAGRTDLSPSEDTAPSHDGFEEAVGGGDFAPGSWSESSSGSGPRSEDFVGEALARVCFEQRCETAVQGISTFAAGEVLAKRYVVGQLIARGGMGEVYLAFDQMLRERVAIKAVLPTLSDDPRAIRRLCREVRLARRVRHPNVCRVHDIGIHDPDPRDVVYFMTMDYIEGKSLRKFARARPLGIIEASRIARQILLGLGAIHTAGILHRDLKSDNVMITEGAEETRAILIDFGLSRSLGRGRRVAGAPMSGSMGYMAPEQMDGKELSPRTDIFAFGVVLFELLTGMLPFERRGPQLVNTAQQWTAPAPSALRSEVPAALDEVVARCLRYAPRDRFADAGSVAYALSRFDSRRSA